MLVTLSLVLANLAACNKKSEAPASPPAPDPHAAPAAPDAAVAPVDAAPVPVVDAMAAAAADARQVEDPRASELCSKVLAKIVECQKDKAFLSALHEGIDANRLKLSKRFLKEVARWKEGDTDCSNLAPAIEYGGFLDHWSVIAAVPDVLESCGKLGTMINSAGGLFGGDRAD